MPACSIARDNALATFDVDGRAEVGIDARPVPVHEGGEDALALGPIALGRAVLQADPVAGGAGEVALDVVRREEHEGVEPGQLDLLDGGLGLEQGREGLRLAVGQQDGVILGPGLAARRSGSTMPASPVIDPPHALHLDQPEALLGQDEQIDLVDGPVVGLELEVGPGPVRVVVGQTPLRTKSRPRRSHSYFEGVMMFQRGDSMLSLGPTPPGSSLKA